MPQDWKATLPASSARDWLLQKDIHLGLDLAGGRQLDFVVNLDTYYERVATEKAATEARGELFVDTSFTASQIVSGVKETLRRRIDPDNTRELNIYSSKFGDEWHIVVELTKDLDSQETVNALTKVIDLEFKELRDDNADNSVVNALAQSKAEKLLAAAKTDFDSVAAAAVGSKNDLTIEYVKTATGFADELPAAVATTETGALTGVVANPDDAGEFSIYKIIARTQVERDTTPAAENFATVAGADAQPQEISQLVDEAQKQQILQTVQPWGVSEVLPTADGKFAIYQLIKANDDGEVRLLPIIADTADAAAALRERVAPTATSTQAEQLEFARLTVLATPDPWQSTGLTGINCATICAKPDVDQFGTPITLIQFDQVGAEKFAKLTERLVGKPMAIFVGGQMVSAPIIQTQITGGSAQITFGSGDTFSLKKEAFELARNINSGAIPAPVTLDGQVKVAATLGQDSLNIAMRAALIGFIVVALVIVAVYRMMGAIAIISLLIYGLLFIGMTKLFPFFIFPSLVLTLSGIAGVMLSLGLAVDANVLIFERVREELNNGRTYAVAVSSGFDRAWNSIRDANATTILVCLILYVLGTQVIAKFALMLGLGTLISMFTAVTITRMLLRLLQGTKLSKNTKLLLGV